MPAARGPHDCQFVSKGRGYFICCVTCDYEEWLDDLGSANPDIYRIYLALRRQHLIDSGKDPDY